MAPKTLTPSHVVATQGNSLSHICSHAHIHGEKQTHTDPQPIFTNTNVLRQNTIALILGDTHTNEPLPNTCAHTHTQIHHASPRSTQIHALVPLPVASPAHLLAGARARLAAKLLGRAQYQVFQFQRQRWFSPQAAVGQGSHLVTGTLSLEFAQSSHWPVGGEVPVLQLYSVKRTLAYRPSNTWGSATFL